MTRGKFITFEGIDASGKSTQAALLCERLTARGIEAVRTREPGGSALAERIRDIALRVPEGETQPDGISETLLMFAARREHILRRIAPALAAGRWVVCDRFTDSTFAYQGGGRGVDADFISQLARQVQGGIAPDLTFYLESPAATSPNPLFSQEIFEHESKDFYKNVIKAYKKLAQQQKQRIVVIKNGSPRRDRDEIGRDIWQALEQRLLPAG